MLQEDRHRAAGAPARGPGAHVLAVPAAESPPPLARCVRLDLAPQDIGVAVVRDGGEDDVSVVSAMVEGPGTFFLVAAHQALVPSAARRRRSPLPITSSRRAYAPNYHLCRESDSAQRLPQLLGHAADVIEGLTDRRPSLCIFPSSRPGW